MTDAAEMPNDWDDHAGWERYYARVYPDGDFQLRAGDPGSFSFERLGDLIGDLHERGWTTIWFPGCGLSPLPRVFYEFGCRVHATDVSKTAVQFQNESDAIGVRLKQKVRIKGDGYSRGEFHATVHDFREAYEQNTFDVLFNVKAFQGLPNHSKALAAQSHYDSLKAGRLAFFDTKNVQGDDRDEFEVSLVAAGFYIPLFDLNSWYRKALAETQIPYYFVLGTPMIPHNDEYPHGMDSEQRKRDSEVLRRITQEYRARMESEFAREQQTIDENVKQAEIIYSTG
jgi:hypothetical protein